MSVMIQIRNVEKDLHGTLKSRASAEGMSLSDYIKGELRRSVQRPTLREWAARVKKHGAVQLPVSSAELIRSLRDSR